MKRTNVAALGSPHKPLSETQSISDSLVVIVLGLMLVELARQGGFWKPDSLVVAVAAMILILGQVLFIPASRTHWAVICSLLALAAWWFIRASISGPGTNAMPFAASIAGFVAAFIVVSSLRTRERYLAGLAVAGLGTIGAALGFAGLFMRWFPMAMRAQNLWRLSTTLTYSDAAGLFLGLSLLVALAGDKRNLLSRIAVCLCAGGLIAAQSRGALIAVLCAAAFVPLRQYLEFLVPLIAGAVLGIAAVATSHTDQTVPLLGVVFVIAVLVSLMQTPSKFLPFARRHKTAIWALVIIALVVSGLIVHYEIALRVLSPSSQDRAVEWSAALHQFESSPLFGVGPDRLLHFHASDGTYAHFAHNEYLQVLADGGLVGFALLIFAMGVLAKAVRRVDVISSCAVAALVCFAVGGVFDFDWHLPFLGLLAGWIAGLSVKRTEEMEVNKATILGK
jgi:O-antigen ligase